MRILCIFNGIPNVYIYIYTRMPRVGTYFCPRVILYFLQPTRRCARHPLIGIYLLCGRTITHTYPYPFHKIFTGDVEKKKNKNRTTPAVRLPQHNTRSGTKYNTQTLWTFLPKHIILYYIPTCIVYNIVYYRRLQAADAARTPHTMTIRLCIN